MRKSVLFLVIIVTCSVFGSVQWINMASRQLLGARNYIVSYRDREWLHRRNFRGCRGGPHPSLFGVGGQTPLYKYTMSEILLAPSHFSEQRYATEWVLITYL